jgi:hypothetical protein
MDVEETKHILSLFTGKSLEQQSLGRPSISITRRTRAQGKYLLMGASFLPLTAQLLKISYLLNYVHRSAVANINIRWNLII